MTALAVEPIALPRVNGRHRDRALASARKLRAIELKMQGLNYQQIADELGYTNRGTVYKIIRDAQASRLSEAVETQRELELARLDALQAALWPDAMAGDVQASHAALKVIEARCRLLGLIRPGRAKQHGCRQPQTVVLMEDDCRLRDCPDHG